MKKFIAIILCLLSFSVMAAPAVVEGTTFGVMALSPSVQNPAIFLNTYTGVGLSTYPMGTWSTVTTAGKVPAGTKAVRLDGILIITHGTTAEDCNLTAAVKTNASDPTNYAYVMQTIEAVTTGGQRSNAGTWVALDANGNFQLNWTESSPAGTTWPTYCAYAINLYISAYIR